MTESVQDPDPATGRRHLALHRRTVRHTVRIVERIQDHQWDLPTSCSAWTLRQLLDHMIRENRGFAAAAAGERADASPWTSPVGPDRRGEYARSAEQVVAAFAAPDLLGRDFWLPLINGGELVPAPRAVSFHLLDYLLHGWDVATAAGLVGFVGSAGALPEGFLAPDVVAAVHRIAVREVPDGPRRHRVGASFGPPVPVPADVPAFDQLLAFLGRRPAVPGESAG
jgi:uncharacterized protein (TIGR03086 family)